MDQPKPSTLTLTMTKFRSSWNQSSMLTAALDVLTGVLIFLRLTKLMSMRPYYSSFLWVKILMYLGSLV